MKILSIGADRNIFKESSEVRRRMVDYGGLAEELHIIVFTTRKFQITNSKFQITNNIFLYPTNSWSRWFYICDAIKIGKKILTDNLQLTTDNWVVTTQDPFETGLVGWRITKKFKLPLQLQIHTDFLSPYFAKESFLNRIRVKIAKFLLSRADGIRVVSNRIKKGLKAKSYKLKADIIVLPIFVDIQRIRQAPVSIDLHKKYPDYDFIILMASRLTSEKNISLAIEAFVRITKREARSKNLLLLIVGDGPEREALKKQVIRNKLQGNIILEPAVPFEILVSYYKTADLYLLTSNYEGYGMTLTEATSIGLPIVSTDVGIAGEIKGINVVPVGDSKAATSALVDQIKNPQATSFKDIGSYEDYLNQIIKSWEACKKF